MHTFNNIIMKFSTCGSSMTHAIITQIIINKFFITKFSLSLCVTHRPTNFSKTDDFPDDWIPTTAICGRSMSMGTSRFLNVSWSLLTVRTKFFMPGLESIAGRFCGLICRDFRGLKFFIELIMNFLGFLGKICWNFSLFFKFFEQILLKY